MDTSNPTPEIDDDDWDFIAAYGKACADEEKREQSDITRVIDKARFLAGVARTPATDKVIDKDVERKIADGQRSRWQNFVPLDDDTLVCRRKLGGMVRRAPTVAWATIIALGLSANPTIIKTAHDIGNTITTGFNDFIKK